MFEYLHILLYSWINYEKKAKKQLNQFHMHTWLNLFPWNPTQDWTYATMQLQRVLEWFITLICISIVCNKPKLYGTSHHKERGNSNSIYIALFLLIYLFINLCSHLKLCLFELYIMVLINSRRKESKTNIMKHQKRL